MKVIAETTAAAEDGESVVVANGTLDGKTATKEMKADFEALTGKLVDAGKALSADVRAAIPAEIGSEAVGDAPLAASQPFRSVASKYPATVTVKLDNPDSFVGIMSFVNGKWVRLNAVINNDGTVIYVLTEPSVLSFITQTARTTHQKKQTTESRRGNPGGFRPDRRFPTLGRSFTSGKCTNGGLNILSACPAGMGQVSFLSYDGTSIGKSANDLAFREYVCYNGKKALETPGLGIALPNRG